MKYSTLRAMESLPPDTEGGPCYELAMHWSRIEKGLPVTYNPVAGMTEAEVEAYMLDPDTNPLMQGLANGKFVEVQTSALQEGDILAIAQNGMPVMTCLYIGNGKVALRDFGMAGFKTHRIEAVLPIVWKALRFAEDAYG